MTPRDSVLIVYQVLLQAYGPQGWWPVRHTLGSLRNACDNRGYHPGCFDIPGNDQQRLEIALGALLTQNTAWTNASTALASLAENGKLSVQELLGAETEQIALAIRSAGYYNQKARAIKEFCRFLNQHPFAVLATKSTSDVRKLLLQVRGIGPETADCILLYALNRPSFVVDAYTRRIFSHLGIVPETIKYDSLQVLFEASLPPDHALFQEYHALLVQHGKQHYSRKPHGKGDAILRPALISGTPEKNGEN